MAARDTRKDTLLKKRHPYIFLCAKVYRSMTTGCRGIHRISGDTAGSWFWKPAISLKKSRGGYCSKIQKKKKKGHCKHCWDFRHQEEGGSRFFFSPLYDRGNKVYRFLAFFRFCVSDAPPLDPKSSDFFFSLLGFSNQIFFSRLPRQAVDFGRAYRGALLSFAAKKKYEWVLRKRYGALQMRSSTRKKELVASPRYYC